MAASSPLDQKPKLSQLQTLPLLIPLACTKWYEIGIGLKLGDEDEGDYLEELRMQQEEEEKKLFAVLKKWLRDSKHNVLQPAKWRTLMRVLEGQKLDMQDLKDNLLYDFKGSVSPTASPAGNTARPAVTSVVPPATKTGATSYPRPGMASAVPPATKPGATSCSRPKHGPRPGLASTVPPASKPAALPALDGTPYPRPPPQSIPLPSTLSPAVGSGPSTSPAAPPSPPLLDCLALEDLESIGHEIPKSTRIDFSLKMGDGREVREYQKELAEPGIKGENYIIIAPTGSGKTLVAALVVSNHLQNHQLQPSCHVVFVVSTKPLAEQQMKQFDDFIPGAQVDVYTGDNPGTVADSIKHKNHISVCTAGKLLDEIRKGLVKFDQLSLMIFDECHHAGKGHPYAKLMELYLEYREKKPPQNLLQIIGMTASPGAGENFDLDKKKTIDHLLQLTAVLDATGGFKYVTKNVAELQKATKSSSRTRKILKPRDTSRDTFIDRISEEMAKLEASVSKMKNNFDRWSQEYETRVQQVKQPLELEPDKKVRDDISTLNLLRCYSNALRVYMDLRQKDAIQEMEGYSGFPDDDHKATPHEIAIRRGMELLLEELKWLPPIPNPLLENMMETLRDTFQAEPTSRAILFIRTKKHAYAVRDWVHEHCELQTLIKPDVITGHTREAGPAGMTQVQQEEVMHSFRNGETNLLIATSVAEEGLDVPECNLVIRFQHVSSEIAQVQTEGRARAENSQGITILSSDSKKKIRELKNKELNILVDEIFENKHFPVGQHLERELKKVQQKIISHRRMKAAMKAKRRQSFTGDTVRLFCKTCKELACLGSDVHMIGSEGAHHYVVPEPEFQNKYFCKNLTTHNPRDLITNEVKRTHKIFCATCERDWGVKCIWPTNGRTFPVIKCAAFIFEIEGIPRPLKKWSDAPFEMKSLTEWLSNNSMDDSYSSSSSDAD